ncbi:MAG: 30S ribosomal protein S16 [Gammaproteobacteria bacterium]
MVVIRLSRGGAKKRPFYHIVVTDRRAKRDGTHVERIGYFNPKAAANETRLSVDMERVNFWIGRGAVPSERVAKLIKQQAA